MANARYTVGGDRRRQPFPDDMSEHRDDPERHGDVRPDRESDRRPGDEDAPAVPARPIEIGGYDGPEPTRHGDWEHKGRCTDF